MSEYSIESTLAYINYNIKEALIATYTAPILLREYPEVLKLARKLGITISTEIPDARLFTSLCKLILSDQVLVCYFRKSMDVDVFHRRVEQLFRLMEKSRPDVVRASALWAI